jgi:hypothetical protein
MRQDQFRKRISTSATTPVVNQGCTVSGINISVESPGTSWKFKLQDRAVPPFVLAPETVLAAQSTPQTLYQNFNDNPVFMEGGIDVVTSAGTPGAVCIWVTAWVNE